MASSKSAVGSRRVNNKKPVKKSAKSVVKSVKVAKISTGAKKTTTKKATKKVVKKTVKKTSKRISVPKSQTQSFSEKLASREAIHKNTSVPTKAKVSPKAQLTLLSPYRFPLNIDNFAIQTARMSGVFFVLLGAFFTLLYSQYITTGTTLASITAGISNTASVCDATDPNYSPNDPACGTTAYEGGVTFDIDPISGCYMNDQPCLGAYYGPNESPASVNETPGATITLDKGEPLSELVEITIEVFEADEIIVYVYNRLTDSPYRLGDADRLSDNIWVYNWVTTQQPDGEYKIRAFIKNQYGSYEEFSQYYNVENNPTIVDESTPDQTSVPPQSSTTDSVSSSTNSLITDISPSSPTANIIDVAIDQTEPVSGNVRILMDIDNADKVKLSAYNKDTDKKFLLGYAYLNTSNDWRYVFRSNK